jgi:hemolysin activation/secretion protein
MEPPTGRFERESAGARELRGKIRLAGQVRAFAAACLWLAAGAVFCTSVFAQTPNIPGSLAPGRERFQFQQPPSPQAQPVGPRVSLPSTVAPEGADKIKLTIRTVKVEGSTVYSADELRVIYQDLIGHEVTLQAVYDVAQRITAKYGIDGYVLSRAIVPPQNFARHNATVRIEVVEGYIDKVVWPEKLVQYRDYFTHYAAMIIADRPSNVRTVERYLLLAGDLPGLKFSTSLKASEKNPKAATLYVEVAYKPFDALARIDNRGPAGRGPLEYLASVTANNVFGQQDALTFTYAGVYPTQELLYAAANYRQVLNAEGLTGFVNVSDGWGRPGTELLEMLQFKTRTLYLDTGMTYPIIRSRERNLSFTGLFFGSDSTSDALGQLFNDDRLRGLRAKVDADMADFFGGLNLLNVTASQGFSGLGSTENGNPLASRADGRVDFTKFEMLATHTQPIFGGPFSAYFAGYGQYATTSLLTPEQCSFGGRYFGRAYDPSEILSDSCYMGTTELRYDIPVFWQMSQIQFYGFTDGGELFDRVPGPGFPSWVHAASAGAGLRLGWLNNSVTADVSIARAIDGPRDDTRGFFILTGRY